MERKELPEYEAPSIVTYTEEEILEELVRYSTTKIDRVVPQKISREVLAF